MGRIPEFTKEFEAALGRNLDPSEKQAPWERAPSHVVEYDECIDLNRALLAGMSKKAGEARTEERVQRISDLRLKYQHRWGKRGAAKQIASFETEAGNPLSERTIQKYFRLGR
jgi:hypothetical protein